MSLNIINNIISEEDINYILTLPQVLQAKKNIDSKTNGSVYFSISLTESLKQTIVDNFGITLDTVPMRWIKGDTMPHIDNGSKKFEKTHLVYLTDSQGEFLLENNSYPMTKGSAFIFNEGLRHETVDTGLEPRLLLGPMSEEGIVVGISGIYGPGGTSIYIRDVGSGIEYSDDEESWYSITVPIYVVNTDTSVGMLTIEFTTDITISDSYQYLICGSDNIQFGSKTLKEDGTRPNIYINGLSGDSSYDGFIKNYNGSNGYNSIHIFNLAVLSINGSTLFGGGGWLCQSYFGTEATDNYIINCYSDGEIAGNYSGGIVGSYAATGITASLTIIGCSSSGEISGVEAGGIVGSNYNLESYTGTLTIQSCWSNGIITNTGGGGIVGSYGGYNGNLIVSNCYHEGLINGTNSGGIVGLNPGVGGNFNISNCYSTGLVNGNGSGGICAACDATGVTITGTITNCYSSGNVNNDNAGAISGVQTTSSGGTNNITIQNCYACGLVSSSLGYGYIIAGVNTIPLTCYSEAYNDTSEWNSSNADTVLTGYPSSGSVGSTWITIGIGIPYLLFNMGYNPYSTTNISETSLIRTSASTLNAGNSSNPGIKPDLYHIFYAILKISGGDSGSYSSITINPANGVISTTSTTVLATYTLYLYNSGSYNITTFTLTVTQAPTPTPTPTPRSQYFPVQRISFNQKSSFCGTRAVSSTAVGIGAIRGKGSATRIFNNCRGNNSVNFQLCQYRCLGYK